MMPVIFGDAKSLGDDYQHDFPLTQECPYLKDGIGRVGYLRQFTRVMWMPPKHNEGKVCISRLQEFSRTKQMDTTYPAMVGGFHYHTSLEGGMFMASDKSRIWNAWVDRQMSGFCRPSWWL
ncbi:expressed unknown protein [Seminavis robusta]|uniref:Uncharacterized protein n=1 Tax=Seminavis robusta TaxID=568900 RepID=A0A9N8F1I1_9STRA|nr:expressed unknown protein [Seminavis robusta]|eukprot:Sro3071_g343180.1 n/a (121) ;mRNA; r:6768-7130